MRGLYRLLVDNCDIAHRSGGKGEEKRARELIGSTPYGVDGYFSLQGGTCAECMFYSGL